MEIICQARRLGTTIPAGKKFQGKNAPIFARWWEHSSHFLETLDGSFLKM